METYGWDVISAVPLHMAAYQLRQASLKFKDASFNFANPDAHYNVTGTLGGPWIILSGAGERITLRLVISGSIEPAVGAAVPFSGSATIEISLDLMPSTVKAGSQDLVFRFTAGSSSEDGNGAVSIVEIQLDQADPLGFRNSARLKKALTDCLCTNQDKFAFVFATIASTPQAAWLKPVRSAFVIDAPTGGASPTLAILGVTTDRDISNLQRKVDPAIAVQDGLAALALTKDLFLSHILLPSLPAAFGHGTSTGTFQLKDGKITNTGSIDLDSQKCGLIRYYPSIDSLSVEARTNEIALDISGSCNLKAGCSMTFHSTSVHGMKLSDKGQLIFAPDPKPEFDYDTDVPTWEKVLGSLVDFSEIIGVICKSIGGSIGGTVQDTAANLPIVDALNVVEWTGIPNASPASVSLDNAFTVLSYASFDDALPLNLPTDFTCESNGASVRCYGLDWAWPLAGQVPQMTTVRMDIFAVTLACGDSVKGGVYNKRGWLCLPDKPSLTIQDVQFFVPGSSFLSPQDITVIHDAISLWILQNAVQIRSAAADQAKYYATV